MMNIDNIIKIEEEIRTMVVQSSSNTATATAGAATTGTGTIADVYPQYHSKALSISLSSSAVINDGTIETAKTAAATSSLTMMIWCSSATATTTLSTVTTGGLATYDPKKDIVIIGNCITDPNYRQNVKNFIKSHYKRYDCYFKKGHQHQFVVDVLLSVIRANGRFVSMNRSTVHVGGGAVLQHDATNNDDNTNTSYYLTTDTMDIVESLVVRDRLLQLFALVRQQKLQQQKRALVRRRNRAAAVRPSKRRVRFQKQVRVKPTLHHQNYTHQEKTACWYGKEDYTMAMATTAVPSSLSSNVATAGAGATTSIIPVATQSRHHQIRNDNSNTTERL